MNEITSILSLLHPHWHPVFWQLFWQNQKMPRLWYHEDDDLDGYASRGWWEPVK